MNNDIKQYMQLIESIILDESFRDAEIKFAEVNGNQKEVQHYIELYKDLAKRNKIQGMDKDISRWIKPGWDDFKQFVDSKKDVQSKSEVKSIQKKDSIQVYKDEEKMVVIPLTKEASIHYGRNTEWCTAYTKSKNHFVEYFYINGITLFYVLFRNGDKYACAFHPDEPDTIECFDQLDKSITYNEFEDATGISEEDIQTWYNSNQTKIENSRDLNKASRAVQIAAVQEDGDAILHIKNPSEDVQLAAVQNHGYAIKYIIDKGIVPSEEVQLAAVQKYGDAIRYIDKPSEKLQLAAVKQNGYTIRHIDNPSEELQLVAVSQYGDAIGHIDNPTEKVQLTAVQSYGAAIKFIFDKGITPSEDVQLAAVKQDGGAIRSIDNPSEELQLAALQNHGHAIRYIDKPSEELQLFAVKQNGNAIRHIIDKGIIPSEAVQIAAVSQDGNVIVYIVEKGITLSEQVQLAAVKQAKKAMRYIRNPTEKVIELYKQLYS